MSKLRSKRLSRTFKHKGLGMINLEFIDSHIDDFCLLLSLSVNSYR